MGTFENMFDMGDKVTFTFGGQQLAGRVCGLSAHRTEQGNYDVTYQIQCDGKLYQVEEKAIIKNEKSLKNE